MSGSGRVLGTHWALLGGPSVSGCKGLVDKCDSLHSSVDCCERGRSGSVAVALVGHGCRGLYFFPKNQVFSKTQ